MPKLERECYFTGGVNLREDLNIGQVVGAKHSALLCSATNALRYTAKLNKTDEYSTRLASP